jgi:hypothetical protein
MSKRREPEVILKTDERRIILDLGLERKFTARSGAWDDSKVSLEGDKLGFGQARQVGAVPPVGQATVGAAAGRALLRRRSRWRVTVTAQRKVTSSHDTVTRSDAVTSDAETAGSPGQICRSASVKNRPTACAC